MPKRSPDGGKNELDVSLGKACSHVLKNWVDKEVRGMVVNKIILDIMERIQKVMNNSSVCEDFSPDAAILMGDQVPGLLVRGIVPVVMKKGGNPYGEPYWGHDILAIHRIMAEERLKGRDCQAGDLIDKPDGIIRLVKTPFHFGQFLLPTDLEVIREAWEKDELGFQADDRRTSHMSLIKWESGRWSQVYTLPIAEIAAKPLQQVLHYGSGLFEGIGVERGIGDEVYIFRLKEHFKRFNHGAEFLNLPTISYENFKKMAIQTVQANVIYIPPRGHGRLYLRPNYYDSGEKLKVGISNEHTLCFTAIPIGTAESYFGKNDKPKSFALLLNRARSVRHGQGQAKAIGNYSATIRSVAEAEKKGFSGVVYADTAEEKVRESHASAILFVENTDPPRIIFSPLNDGDILRSITAETIKEMASDLGYEVEERDIPLKEILRDRDSDDRKFREVLAVGTGAAITPIHYLQPADLDDRDVPQPKGAPYSYLQKRQKDFGLGPVGKSLFDYLCRIKSGAVGKYKKYLTVISGC